MSLFSEDALSRSLFEEPTDDIERADAWEGPLGFLVGGIANMSLQQLAVQYFDAASVLMASIQAHQWEDYRLANPILFLYRHALELLLKAILPGAAKIHHLEKLADALVVYAQDKLNISVPSWIPNRIKDLARIDPNSTAFRYGENKDEVTKQYGAVEGEFHVDLFHLQRVMDALKEALVDLSSAHR